MLRRAGQALGRADRARELVAATERVVAGARRRNPAFEGKTVSTFITAPDGVYATNDPADPALRFYASLGMSLAPRIAAIEGRVGAEGRAKLSPERYEVMDADLLVGTELESGGLAELGRETLFERLDAVRGGRYVRQRLAVGTSLAFPSALSLRFAVKHVVPRLAAAIEGGRG